MSSLVTQQYFNSTFLKALHENIQMMYATYTENSALGKIFRVYNSDEFTESFASAESTTVAQKIAEGANIPYTDMSKGYRVSFTTEQVAQHIELTYLAMVAAKDDTEKMKSIVNDQKNVAVTAVMNAMQRYCFDHFNFAFTNTYAVCPDGLPLIDTAHQFSTGATFDNTLTNADFSTDIMDEIYEKMGAFVGPNGEPMPFDLGYILVKKGSIQARRAKQVLGYEKQLAIATVDNVNIYTGGTAMLVETPWITTANKEFFFAVPDYNKTTLKNPLVLSVTDPVHLDRDGFFKNPQNMNLESNVVTAFKHGIAYLPVGIFGSQGA
jgi:hypothetical protein